MIPSSPKAHSKLVLELIRTHPDVQKVVLYRSRALGRQRAVSDINICLEAPSMGLKSLIAFGAQLDDLRLPWPVDLQLSRLIPH